MPAVVQVAGLTHVYVGAGPGGALELLGFTQNGAEVRNRAYVEEVHGDENGGDQGPPIDIQVHGETEQVRLQLTKWDRAVHMNCPRFKGQTWGRPLAAGTLIFAGQKFVRLHLSAAGGVRNYPRAFIRDEVELNMGTKFSTLVVTFECHRDPATGVLLDAAVDGAPTTTTPAP